MQETNADSSAELQWEHLQPVIDEAMHELAEADREAILQRYFEKKPFLQIAAKLGLTENAARMRVERALEKLREILAARGVASTSVALAAVLGAQAVSAAPAALTATVVGTSLAAVAGGAATVCGIFTAAKLKVAVPVACAVAAVVALLVQNETVSELREENAALLSARQTTATNEPSVASNDTSEAERLQREKLELLRLRGEVARLRREMAERVSARSAGVVSNETAEVQAEKESTQQIKINGRIVTGSDEALEIFGLPYDSASRVVTQPEMETFHKRIEEGGQIEFLSEMQVTTLSGRQAQVSSTVTNRNGFSVVEPTYVVNVLPTVNKDGYTIQLTVSATLIPGISKDIDEDAVARHLTTIRVKQFETSATVWDGQTIALTHRFDGKQVVLFVTPTLIAPNGNRVPPDAGQ